MLSFRIRLIEFFPARMHHLPLGLGVYLTRLLLDELVPELGSYCLLNTRTELLET